VATDRELRLKLVTDIGNSAKALGTLQATATTFSGRIKALGADVGARLNTMAIDLAINAGKAAFDFLQTGVQDALALEAATNKMAAAMRTAGVELPVPKMAEWIQKMETATSVSDVDLSNAMAGLLPRFEDARKAQTILAVATDVAAAKGIDLSAALKLVQGAFDGSSKAARTLGTEGLKGMEAVREAGRNAAAQAREVRNSWEGQSAAIERAIGDIGVALAQVFLPKNMDIRPLTQPIIAALDSVTTFLEDEARPAWRAFVREIDPLLDGLAKLDEQLGATQLVFDALNGAVRLATMPIDLLIGIVRDVALVFSKAFEEDIPGAIDAGAVLIRNAIDAFLLPLRTATDAVTSAIRRVFRFFEIDIDKVMGDVLTALTDAAADLGAEALKIGQAIAGGIIDGLAGLAQDIANALSAALPGWAKDFLGWKSGPVQPGYSPPVNRAASAGASRSGAITINITAMSDSYAIERAVINAMRRTGVANGGLKISRIKGY
jgi:hypothetical protein